MLRPRGDSQLMLLPLDDSELMLRPQDDSELMLFSQDDSELMLRPQDDSELLLLVCLCVPLGVKDLCVQHRSLCVHDLDVKMCVSDIVRVYMCVYIA